MSKYKDSKTAKAVAGLVGLVTAVMMMGPVVASADAVSDLQAQIASLMAQINSLNAQLTTVSGGSGSCAYTFATNLKQGQTGSDVMNLQKVLNMSADTQVSVSGAGSPGNETSTFGPATKAAVIKFQNKYASEILTPVGLISGTGFVGAGTRAKLNAMCTTTGGTTTGGTTTGGTGTTGGALMVSSAMQPANSLAPQNASRVPFTKLTVTAGASDVTISGVNVERGGLADDSVFAGVVLLNDDGTQLGIAKTFGSNHQATIGETFTVKAGTSKTLTVAGNMAASLGTKAGQVAAIMVTGINTSSTVSGSLPISGAMHTINATLTMGTATTLVSSFDPNGTQSKEIGTTGLKFAGVRVTAGSAEAIRIHGIRWNQSGSASSNDLANVMVYVSGTAYPTTVSADGKYYNTNLGSGIVVDKGNSIDVYVQGDIVGTGAAGRTVQFDLYKNTDLYITGETYMYGIIATPSSTAAISTGSEFTTVTPWFSGSLFNVTAGSVTAIQKAVSVAAQNIAVNVPSQVLGGYDTDFKGEPITVQSHTFHFATSTATSTNALITNVSIYDQNGAVVAGPVDAVVDVVGFSQKVTFTDSITYPIGKQTYTLKGKIPSGTPNGMVFTASTNPSTDWSNITGQTTGNTISLASFGNFTMNAMTVKGAALAISFSTSPAAQTVVAGSQGRTFANLQLDATQSGEDVRFSSLALTYTGTASNVTACQLFDGSTALNTGSNVVNPSSSPATFTLDQSLTVPKNTLKTLTLKCNVSSGATSGTFVWGMTTSSVNPTVTGVTSGNSVTATGGTISSATMAFGTAGTLAVSISPSSPAYAQVAAGSTGNTAAVIRFRATNEGISLGRLGLKLTSASSSPADLVQVSVWDGATQVGTATFSGTATAATSTFSSAVALPKDADKDLTVKVDTASIGTGMSGTQGALIAIDFNGTDTLGTQGTGNDSGTTINGSGSTLVSGLRLFKSFPTVAAGTIGTTGINDGNLMRFTVTANSNGGVGLNQFKFTIATSTATVTNVNLYGFTDSGYSTGIPGFSSGQIATSNVQPGTGGAVTITPTASANTRIDVPAGTTYYFQLKGSVAGVTTGSSVTTTLLGDSSYPLSTVYAAGGTGMMLAVSGLTSNSLIWSPNSTTTSATTHVDWTNGYGIVGLPSSGLIQTRSN